MEKQRFSVVLEVEVDPFEVPEFMEDSMEYVINAIEKLRINFTDVSVIEVEEIE